MQAQGLEQRAELEASISAQRAEAAADLADQQQALLSLRERMLSHVAGVAVSNAAWRARRAAFDHWRAGTRLGVRHAASLLRAMTRRKCAKLRAVLALLRRFSARQRRRRHRVASALDRRARLTMAAALARLCAHTRGQRAAAEMSALQSAATSEIDSLKAVAAAASDELGRRCAALSAELDECQQSAAQAQAQLEAKVSEACADVDASAALAADLKQALDREKEQLCVEAAARRAADDALVLAQVDGRVHRCVHRS